MENLDRLAYCHGDARAILGLPAGEAVNLSAREMNGLGIFRVSLDGFVIHDGEAAFRLEECQLTRCTLRNLRPPKTRHGASTDFCGAGTSWTDCLFLNCQFAGLGSSTNTFTRCRFEGVEIAGYEPYQTLFEDCEFSKGFIEGLAPHRVTNRQHLNPRLMGLFRQTRPDFLSPISNVQVAFMNCRFVEMPFRYSRFHNAVFEGCTFQDTDASACDFTGVTSSETWWPVQTETPFSHYIRDVLQLIERRCGRDSLAYQRFDSYVQDYTSGKTSDCDYFNHFSGPDIPERDYDRINSAIDRIVHRYAL